VRAMLMKSAGQSKHLQKSMPATVSTSAAAARMRRSRERKREGLRLVQVLLRETEVEALIESGWLEERSRNNPNAVIDALHRLFDRVFSRMRRNAPRTW
jgi:hypothetical protein